MNTPTNNTIALSAVLITLNAEKQLAPALESLRFCDEIVVVDSNSSDNTVALAEQRGARVVQQSWLGFGPQKQFAVAQAKNSWVLCLDADERITPELEKNIRAVMAQAGQGLLPKDVVGFDMPRCNFFLGRYLRHGEGYPDYSRRLFNRQHANWSDDGVHEKVESKMAGARFEKLQGDLLHESAESLESYLLKQNRYTSIQARALAERGKWPGLGKLVLSPVVRFIKFYVVRKGFLDGWPGLVHISIGCFNSFMKYAKTRELMQQQRER
ncbi:MAG: glycosyltransferase family 2 protein [Gammaproteobacteria bacterium]|nr:glycosyltransferase family 2 protein [Gammaproteobacteria bacterium]MBU0848078.1 glycosyltransferase family 2 protein [Gammaproteobacteria bacterium]MBU1266369.1 glycosyltransferase family 2 protein [Gammaproteobacteria bacterium]MBU1529978.1 glycosyltransferase family 2 protein [Gammaproteobacteria bacterium]MBU1779885.1 glycosyltransferase family 2 protein [Gammaproteobacteria bacterium]